jgi:hypothetical protein
MRRARTIWRRPNAGLSADRDIAGGGPTRPDPVQGSRRARIFAPLSMRTLSRTSCAICGKTRAAHGVQSRPVFCAAGGLRTSWANSCQRRPAIMNHPDVFEAAVVGRPDERWGERPVDYVVPRSNATLTADAVRSHLQDRVAKWWIPEDVQITSEIPKTPTGKISKKAPEGDRTAVPPTAGSSSSKGAGMVPSCRRGCGQRILPRLIGR